MNSRSQEIHIFDLDGTLSNNDTFTPFLLGFFKINPKLIRYLPHLSLYAALFCLKQISNHALKEKFLKVLLPNTSFDKINLWSAYYAQHIFEHKLNKQLVNHIEKLKGSGSIIVIATASPNIYVEILAKILGVHKMICTNLARNSHGEPTGDLDGKNCYGEEKKNRVSEWIRHTHPGKITFFYTDHQSDLPLLTYVDHGILVKPTQGLIKLSKDYNFIRLEDYLP